MRASYYIVISTHFVLNLKSPLLPQLFCCHTVDDSLCAIINRIFSALLNNLVSFARKCMLRCTLADCFIFCSLSIFRKQITIPRRLMVELHPHFMEREGPIPPYHSTSVLGKIYDEAKSQQSETVQPSSKPSFFWSVSCHFLSTCILFFQR